MPVPSTPSLAPFTGGSDTCRIIVHVDHSLASCSLANQEVLRWQLNMRKELGDNITHDHIKEFLWRTLKSGQVVPGSVILPVQHSTNPDQ